MNKYRMIPNRLFVAITTVAALAFGATSTADEVGVGEFRAALTNWALASQQTIESEELSLAERISRLSDEQLEVWLSTFDKPEDFLISMDQVARQLENERNFTPAPATARDARPTPRSPTTFTTPFDPDYPPGTGAYADTVINAIDLFNIGGASDVDRCSNADWGDYIGVWWPLNEGIDALDGACVVAGCDPTGIGCAITCGILETAKVALKIAAVPLEACDVHQGAIDGAEIEATYENLLGLLTDVEHIHTDLDAHDANIDGDLAAHDAAIRLQLSTHDADIKALLANIQGTVDENQRLIKISMSRQLETLRLLITPQGQRTINSQVLDCTGDDCPDVSEVIACGLDWPCK